MSKCLSPTGGSIELIIGPMFSEKTTTMIMRARRVALAGRSVALIKYAKDDRYEKEAVIATHTATRTPIRQGTEPATDGRASIRVAIAERLSEVQLEPGETVVGIDEGQFYPDLVEQCEKWAAEGRRVIVAALDGTSARRPFGQVGELIPLCEIVEKIRGVCTDCRERESAFTRRKGALPPAERPEIEIGGQELYRGVCRDCYYANSP